MASMHAHCRKTPLEKKKKQQPKSLIEVSKRAGQINEIQH